ncbi:hypothetical protein N9L92_00180 [Saprospiraceae bacterium]|nr:hypothetical protein [Saprospiraceae bacterium]
MNKIKFFLILTTIILHNEISAQISHNGEDCINKTFQVVAHVAVDSTMREPLYTQDTIEMILSEASTFFERICFSYRLCEYHVLENDYTLGIIRSQPVSTEKRLTELRNRFSMRRRINIYFLESIEGIDCGVGTYQGISTLLDANVFLERKCEEGLAQQLAHQLGHVFGLLDTYNVDEIELADGTNCTTAADRLCSTPADPFNQDYLSPQDSVRLLTQELVTDFVVDCTFVYELRDPNDDFYSPQVGNIMSGYPCKCFFTKEQLLLMVKNYKESEIKHF